MKAIVRWLGKEGADASFSSGERVAGAIECFVIGIVLRTEGAEGFFIAPTIDRHITAGNVGVLEQLCAEVLGRSSEERGPGAVRTVRRFKAGDLVFRNVE